MFRFSRQWHQAQEGLIFPDQSIIDPAVSAETDEYLKLVINMEQDLKAGRVPNLLLDDQDIKKPKNFMDFYFGDPGKNADTNEPIWTPFPKQIQAATHGLQEHCTNRVGHFQCTDMSYVENIPTHAPIDEIREKITFLNHGVCPNCGKTRMDQWNEGNTRKQMVVLAIGQRAGKDECLGFIGGYLHACYLTLRNLGSAYKLSAGTTLYTTFTALTHAQAKKSTYGPFAKIMRDHPWHRQYREMLDFSGQKAGKELYKIGEETMAWPHHGLAVTVEAPHEGTLRGNAKIYATITEYAYFYAKTRDAVKLNGPVILEALNNSFATIEIGYKKCTDEGLFDMPPPLFPLASSPRINKDGIMNLYRESKKVSTMYGMHCSTFEFNPDAHEDMSFFATTRALNPEKYKTSFLALPPDAVSGFIKSRKLVSTMPDEDFPNAVSCKSVLMKSGAGMRQTTGEVRIRTNSKIDKTTPKVMGMDAGLSFNSFSCVVAHVEIDENEETGEPILFTAVDAVIEVIPSKENLINKRAYYENVIAPVCEELNVKYVYADRWESTSFIDNVGEDYGIYGQQYRCVYQDFLSVRSAIDDKLIVLPKNEITEYKDAVENIDHIFKISESNYPYCFNGKPIAHLLYQLLTVEDHAGKTVDKGENSTDDTFRALVLAHRFCHDPEIQPHVIGTDLNAGPQDEGFAFVSMGMDGRLMEQKSFATNQTNAMPSTAQTSSFGVVVPWKS